MTTILCYGDSNTWGANPSGFDRFPPTKRWPGVLRRHLPGCDVVEEGLRGRTTIFDDPFKDGRNGLTYLGPCLDTHAPVDLVVLMLGTNDVKTIFTFDAAGIAAGAARLVEVVQRSPHGPGQRPPKVLLVAPPPVAPPPSPLQRVWGYSAASVERARELPLFYRAAAANLGCAFLEGGTVASVSPLDGVHLDEAAHAALAAAIAASAQELLL